MPDGSEGYETCDDVSRDKKAARSKFSNLTSGLIYGDFQFLNLQFLGNYVRQTDGLTFASLLPAEPLEKFADDFENLLRRSFWCHSFHLLCFAYGTV